jgi:hypothetical protein
MKIEDVFKKLKPLYGEELDRVWQEYIASDAKLQKLIETALRISLAQHYGETYEEREILLEPPPASLSCGEYPLGMVFYGKEKLHLFGLREDEFIQHTGIFGRSGSGKTNVAFLLVINLLRKSKPFLVFDWKRNYRDLLSLGFDRDILVFTVGRNVSPFYFNPLIPPEGTPLTVWLKKLIEIMCHAYFLGEGVAYLMQKAIDSVYRAFDSYDRKAEAFPTISDVKQWLENHKVKGREGSWMESAIRAVGVLCYGEMGRVLNQTVSFPLENLLEKNVILELDALTNSDKTFLIEALLLWLHHYRLAQGSRETFKHGVIIEEAHHILLRKKQEITGEEAVTDVILREIRELGEGIILIDQHPSLISKPALGNTYCTIAMNLKHRSDVNMISECMLLDSKKSQYLGKLPVGSAMVKLQGRWFDPFLVRFPLVRLEKGIVTDEIVGSRMKSFYEGRSEQIMSCSEVSGPFQPERRDILPLLEKEKEMETKGTEGAILTTIEREFLNDVAEYELSNTTDRYRRLNLSSYMGNKIKNSLIRKNFVSVSDVPFGNSRIKILELREKGKELLGVQQKEKKTRKGGAEHEFWRKKIAEHLKAEGYEVTEEFPIGQGKTIDLVAEKPGERIAVEIETGKSNPSANIEKCMTSNFACIWVVFTNRKEKEAFLSKWKSPSNTSQIEVQILSVEYIFSPDQMCAS